MMASLTGTEQVSVLPQTEIGGPAPGPEITTTRAIANLAGVTVTDGSHTVAGASEINFTSGATVTASGSVADVAISGGGGGGPISESTVTLSSADLLAAAATPITVVPGVPSKTIIVVCSEYRLSFGTVAYTGGGSGTGLWYGSISGGRADFGPNGIENSTSSMIIPSSANQQLFDVSVTDGTDVVYAVGSATPLLAGDGSMTVTVQWVAK